MAIFFTPFSHTVPGLKFGGVSFLCFSCWMVGCTLLFPDAISEKAEMPALLDADEHLPACLPAIPKLHGHYFVLSLA
jgi:hypothetical protein